MSCLSDYAENLVLTWLLTATAATRPSAWFVALHTGDPGETGASNEVLVATDADYVRKAITFADASGGQSLSTLEVSWTVNSASAGYTVTHASVHDALSAGNCLFKGPLLASRALIANGVLTFSVGEIVATAD